VARHPYDVRNPDAERPRRNGDRHGGKVTHVFCYVTVDVSKHYLAPGRRRGIQDGLAKFV
jgi:hypothetical protein